MPGSDVEVVVVGGGAAGIGAARALPDAGVDVVIIEARSRLGGRAWTDTETAGHAMDLGCGWLHSGDRNPWQPIAKAQGRTIEKTPPEWYRPSLDVNFPHDQQVEFRKALERFHDRMGELPQEKPDAAASTLLEPGARWNGLLGALTTYLRGTEPEHLSIRDFANYA